MFTTASTKSVAVIFWTVGFFRLYFYLVLVKVKCLWSSSIFKIHKIVQWYFGLFRYRNNKHIPNIKRTSGYVSHRNESVNKRFFFTFWLYWSSINKWCEVKITFSIAVCTFWRKAAVKYVIRRERGKKKDDSTRAISERGSR